MNIPPPTFIFRSRFLGVFLAMVGAASALSDTESGHQPQTISVEGTLIPVREVHQASRSKGVIRFIREEGDRVHQGEPLLILEDSVEKLEVDRQKKILELRDVENSAEEQLRKKDVVSAMELAEKRLNLDLARLNLQQSVEILDRRTVTAPFDGVVTQRLRSGGEAVDELAQVVTMVDVGNLYLEFHLPAGMLGRVKVGQPVTIHVDTPVPADASGTIQLCSPVVNPASREFKVRVLVPNPDGRLTAGVSARGVITAAGPETLSPASSANTITNTDTVPVPSATP